MNTDMPTELEVFAKNGLLALQDLARYGEGDNHTMPSTFPPDSRVVYARNGLKALSVLCHGRNVEAGWWTDPKTGLKKERNKGELYALMHSELSEALEADRKNLMDDKLPHRRGIEVELADFLIRAHDYDGAYSPSGLINAVITELAEEKEFDSNINFGEAISHIHNYLSRACHSPAMYEGLYLGGAMAVAFQLAAARDLDLPGAFLEKMAYNQTRADHKLVNRAKEDGKKY